MNELVILAEEIQNNLMKCWETKVHIIIYYKNNNIEITVDMKVEDVEISDIIYITDGINTFSINKSNVIHIEKIEETVSVEYELKFSNNDEIILSFI